MTGDAPHQVAVSVRSATMADIPEILAIEQQSAGASHWSPREYERILAEEVLMVAVVGGQVIGFIAAKHAADQWQLENIAVAPRLRRCAVGAQLLQTLIAHIRPRSGSFMFLEVRESNLPARRLYAKYGFVEIGRRQSYYHQPDEDALLYRFDLGPKA